MGSYLLQTQAVYHVPISTSGVCGQPFNVCPTGQSYSITCSSPQVTSFSYPCELPAANYHSFRLQWSASGPLGIGVGTTVLAPCYWYDGGIAWGGSFRDCSGSVPANSTGDVRVTADWNAVGYVTFFWSALPLNGPNVTVYSFDISAYPS